MKVWKASEFLRKKYFSIGNSEGGHCLLLLNHRNRKMPKIQGDLRMSWYPRWVYSPRIDVTQRNMRDYDAKQRRIENETVSRCPDYYKLPLRERLSIRNRIEEEMS